MGNLKGKNILFIGPRFYNYHEVIKQELEKKGAIVTFFKERIYGIGYLILSALGNRASKLFNEYRYSKIVQTKDEYDYLFVIKGESTPLDFVKRFKKCNPNAVSIMYQWDSLKNHNYLDLIDLFDHTLSFDLKDCEEHSALKYQPLFYTKEIEYLRNENSQDIDVLILGTYLRERYFTIRKIQECAKQNGLNLYAYMYIPRSYYYFEKYFNKIDICGDFIHHSYLNKEDVCGLYGRSKSIIDISSIAQTGLSMRVIECLAAHRKLITTNQRIIAQPFFDKNVISILNSEEIILDKDFINAPIVFQSDDLDKLRIDKWLDKVFCLD